MKFYIYNLGHRGTWISPYEINSGQSAMLQVFLRLIRFHLSASFHNYSFLIFILTLVSSEGKAGEAWEPSK
jgi:hypothetical protein